MEHTLERAPLQFPIGTIINGPVLLFRKNEKTFQKE